LLWKKGTLRQLQLTIEWLSRSFSLFSITHTKILAPIDEAPVKRYHVSQLWALGKATIGSRLSASALLTIIHYLLSTARQYICCGGVFLKPISLSTGGGNGSKP
jgi:hypothetical protein